MEKSLSDVFKGIKLSTAEESEMTVSRPAENPKKSPKTSSKKSEAKPETEKSAPEQVVNIRGVEIKEELLGGDCYLFTEEIPALIFCKPKLIPLKTHSTQRQEELKMRPMESEGRPNTASSGDTWDRVRDSEDDQPSSSDPVAASPADIWSAE